MKRACLRDYFSEHSITVMRPKTDEKENWIGAPSACFDQEANTWWLLVRHRDYKRRGYKTVLYRTTDGVNLKHTTTYTTEQLAVRSIERGAIVRDSDVWKIYLSWECKNCDEWVVALAENEKLERIEPEDFTILRSGSSYNTDMIKDPVLYEGKLYAHIRKDALKSSYLVDHNDIVKVIRKTVRWDRYCQRITSIIRTSLGYFAFYDGAESISYNQEEKTGVLFGVSPTAFVSVTEDYPVLTSEYGSGSIRYLEAKEHRGEVWIWYECCTENWSHELRFLKVEKNELVYMLNSLRELKD